MPSGDKIYVKIEGIKGSVKVSGFTDCFEASYADGGAIINQFSASNNGQSYAGVPVVNNLQLTLKNVDGSVSSTLQQNVLKAQPLKKVKYSQITRLNGKDTETSGKEYEKCHIIAYHYNPATRDVQLEIGNFASFEETHYTIAEDGAVTPHRVKYDLTTQATT